jgi:hypothetical protein
VFISRSSWQEYRGHFKTPGEKLDKTQWIKYNNTLHNQKDMLEEILWQILSPQLNEIVKIRNAACATAYIAGKHALLFTTPGHPWMKAI